MNEKNNDKITKVKIMTDIIEIVKIFFLSLSSESPISAISIRPEDSGPNTETIEIKKKKCPSW